MFDIEDLKKLANQRMSPAVSMYLPSSPLPNESESNRIRLKNVINEAYEQLLSRDVPGGQADELLAPARTMLGDNGHVSGVGPGLGLFVGPGFFESHQIPAEVPQQVEVGEYFDIGPLVPLVTSLRHFYVINVSLKQNRLINCTQYRATPVALPDAYDSLDDYLRYGIDEKQQQVRPMASPRGRRSGVAHGQGSYADRAVQTRQIREYLLSVARAVEKNLAAQQAPLVFAGLEDIYGIFRQVCGYRNLCGNYVKGNLDKVKDAELKDKAWEALRPQFEEEFETLTNRYHQALSNGLASRDPHKILPAAVNGYVEVLMADFDTPLWGRCELPQGNVEVHDRQNSGDVNLVDMAAMHTYLHDGQVYDKPRAVNQSDEAHLMAILRRGCPDSLKA